MILKSPTIIWIQKAIFFGEEIRKLFTNIQKPENIQAPLQNALMFCLKAIGTCLDKAAESENINLEQDLRPEQRRPYDTLLFWKNLHHLRNSLIHHFDQNMLHNFSLQTDEFFLLFNICKNAGQIVFYLRLVANQNNTSVDLKGQRFKVFIDIHELARLLAIHNPREIRAKIPQSQYLQAMTDAIGITLKHIIPNIENPSINTLETEKYYALQNMLECVATLGNPNVFGATQRIGNSSRNAIFSIEPNADKWLRDLGQSRIKALHTHGTIVIPDDEVRTHLRNLQLLHRVLLNPRLANTSIGMRLTDKFNILAPTETQLTIDVPQFT